MTEAGTLDQTTFKTDCIALQRFNYCGSICRYLLSRETLLKRIPRYVLTRDGMSGGSGIKRVGVCEGWRDVVEASDGWLNLIL